LPNADSISVDADFDGGSFFSISSFSSRHIQFKTFSLAIRIFKFGPNELRDHFLRLKSASARAKPRVGFQIVSRHSRRKNRSRHRRGRQHWFCSRPRDRRAISQIAHPSRSLRTKPLRNRNRAFLWFLGSAVSCDPWRRWRSPASFLAVRRKSAVD